MQRYQNITNITKFYMNSSQYQIDNVEIIHQTDTIRKPQLYFDNVTMIAIFEHCIIYK